MAIITFSPKKIFFEIFINYVYSKHGIDSIMKHVLFNLNHSFMLSNINLYLWNVFTVSRDINFRKTVEVNIKVNMKTLRLLEYMNSTKVAKFFWSFSSILVVYINEILDIYFFWIWYQIAGLCFFFLNFVVVLYKEILCFS